MTANSSSEEAPPSSVTNAVLVPSNEMPVGAQKVEELDFNKFAGRPITVDDLMSGMNNMGFQASSIGNAVRIINDMVSSRPWNFNGAIFKPMLFTPSHHISSNITY
jgi:deoxyhypusine synthase